MVLGGEIARHRQRSGRATALARDVAILTHHLTKARNTASHTRANLLCLGM